MADVRTAGPPGAGQPGAGAAHRLGPPSKPTTVWERRLWAEGHDVVAGVDEVGRGAWAGPLSVGVAVVPRRGRVAGVRDSKALAERQREALFGRVARWCTAWSVGHASHAECDELGMSAAQRLATGRAMAALGVEPDGVLVDGAWDFVGRPGTTMVVGGDARCLSIAAASILAKVTRDRLMRQEAGHFPLYDFAANKGYPCPRHRMALAAWGPSAIHRRSWVFMDGLVWGGRVVRPVAGTAAEVSRPAGAAQAAAGDGATLAP
ncbi:MAG: ribonuclease HII [Acidimicrobiales bacterium]